MAQYPIPQFIEAEGKIISFLTFRQFFWLVGGGALCFGLYYILPFFLFIVAAVLIMGFVALVAFLKIDNVSVMTLFLSYLNFSTKSKDYVWKKKQSKYSFATQKPQELVSENSPSKLQDAKKMIEYKKKI